MALGQELPSYTNYTKGIEDTSYSGYLTPYVRLLSYLGVLPGGDQGPDSEPDGPLPVDVEVVDLLWPAVPVPTALTVRLNPRDFWDEDE